MVGRLLMGFVWLYLQFSVSWLVDLYFSGVRVSQSFVFCVMIGRLLVGFVWLNLYFFVSWFVDFQWCSCGSIFSLFGMVGRHLVGFAWLNLQFSVLWQVDFQWGTCGSIFRFLCHVRYTFSVVRVAQSLVFLARLVDFQCGSCVSIFSFLCHGRQTSSGLREAQSLVFCVMVSRLLVGFLWLNLQFSVSWLVDLQWGSCVSIFSLMCHGWETFSWVRSALSLVVCVMVGRLLVGFVWLYLQCYVSWQVDIQWGSCDSIFGFLCHGLQTFSGVRVVQSLVFCVMVGRLLVGFALLNL